MRRLLFITTRLFWPTDSGRKVSLYHYCKGLHDVYGYDIYLYSFLESGQTVEMIENKPDFIKEVVVANKISKINKIKNLFIKSLICSWPFQNSIYFSKKNKKHINKYCAEINPDVVIVDMIRLAPYYSAFKSFNCMKILDMDDLLSNRYKRQYKSKVILGSIFGANSQEISDNSNKILNASVLKRAILKSESKRIYKAETKYGRMYDHIIFVSDKETNELNFRLGSVKAATVALGVDYEYYSENLTINKEKGTIAFLGNMTVAANIDSLNLVVKNILPKIVNKWTLFVVGKINDDIKKLFSDERITFCGMVDDVRTVIKKCEVFLSPVAYGSGVKTKILEAMAMGIPVVTNSLGVEGIDGENGKHFFVSDEYGQIANYVDSLIEDENLSKSIADAAQKLIYDKYRWEVTLDSYRKLDL